MNSQTKRLWLSKSILKWAPESCSGTLQDSERVQRPHELLHHAQSLIQPKASPFSLSDAISNLKRAVNNRLQHIDELYAFSHRFPKNHGVLERLEAVGLARPFLIKKLFDLRNDIEHNDAQPPSLERCSELVDIVWYFLKTTDNACQIVPHGVVLTCVDDAFLRNPSLCVTVDFNCEDTSTAKIAGWLSPSELSQDEQVGFLPIDASVFKTASDSNQNPNNKMQRLIHTGNSSRREDERWVIATFSTPSDFHHSLWRLALEAV